jgi:hypothetical protein
MRIDGVKLLSGELILQDQWGLFYDIRDAGNELKTIATGRYRSDKKSINSPRTAQGDIARRSFSQMRFEPRGGDYLTFPDPPPTLPLFSVILCNGHDPRILKQSKIPFQDLDSNWDVFGRDCIVNVENQVPTVCIVSRRIVEAHDSAGRCLLSFSSRRRHRPCLAHDCGCGRSLMRN